MAQGIQFTNYVPTVLVGVNSPSPTLASEPVTGLPIATGAFPGNVFYLTEQQANQLSQTSVNSAPVLTCHAGWYSVVQVDSGATAGNIAQGYIGAQKAIPTTNVQANANIPFGAIMTDASHYIAPGLNPCVFLNAVTPGNFTIVQISGDASVYVASAQSGTVGSVVLAPSANNGQCTIASGNITATTLPQLVGLTETAVTASALNRVDLSFPFGTI